MSFLTPEYALKKLGDPLKPVATDFCLVAVPAELQAKKFPKKIYCHKAMEKPLSDSLKMVTLLHDMVESFDGCYNVRKMRSNGTAYSLHSWGVAIDINAKTNGQGKIPKLNYNVVQCFKAHGFDWGGDWKMPSTDGMHFQLTKEMVDKWTQLKK